MPYDTEVNAVAPPDFVLVFVPLHFIPVPYSMSLMPYLMDVIVITLDHNLTVKHQRAEEGFGQRNTNC